MDAGNFASWKCNILIQVIGFLAQSLHWIPDPGAPISNPQAGSEIDTAFIFLRSIK